MPPKHYRPAGKKKEGNAAKYITRTKAIKYLQVSLRVFRKLCILKGIFPRVPKKKFEGNHKTYYSTKDINFLLHEPLLEKLRQRRAHEKKVKRAKARKNKELAERLLNRMPGYKLDTLILERYPTFIDAIRDMDDCLTMVHLFASLPAVEGERIQVNRIHKCRRLSHEWQAYICRTHSLRKTFISVKGVYYQAEVQGQKITWLTPHALQQVLTQDVDFNIMLTFLEFYEALLGFVNFKLYHSINVKYPPILDSRLEALAAELYALFRYVATGSARKPVETQTSGLIEEKKDTEEKMDPSVDESELRLAQLQHQLPSNEPGTLMQLLEDSNTNDDDDDEDPDTKECRTLFKSLKFFLSREVPREALLFIIPAFGGVVSWEGEGAPFKETDEDIAYQIVDRPTQGHKFLSRHYVQPQWVFDCINARIILPTDAYLVGMVPPPHLSPFVDDEAEGYVPEYGETIKRLQTAAKKNVMPLPDLGNQDIADPQSLLAQGIIDRTQANEAAEERRKLLLLEKQYHDELKKEMSGTTYSSSLSNKNSENTGSDEMQHQDEDMVPVSTEKDDEDNRAKLYMSRKKKGLFEAMEISNQRKKSKVELLKERKRKAESSKTG
ncbi:pescadillo-like protein [Carex rostrata]